MKMPAQKLIAIVISATLIATLGGCANKQQYGMLGGAAAGGVACGAATKNSPTAVKLIATGGCAVVGLFAGSALGKYFDDQDKAELDSKAREAARSGSGVTTYKSKSGATARMEVGKAYTKREVDTVQRSTAVQTVPSMTKLNALYVTTKGVNVRSAPSTKGAKLAFLPAQTEFAAVGKTGGWIAVSQKGSLVGYVSEDLVQSKASLEAALAERLTTPGEKEPRIEPTYVPALKLDEATAETRPELAKVVEQKVVIEKVEKTSTCKTIKSTITGADGKAGPSDTSDVCQEPAAPAAPVAKKASAWDDA